MARAAPTTAQDAAPTPQLQSAQTLPQPRSPPVPRNQPQTTRRSLPGLTALTNTAIPPPPIHQVSQMQMEGGLHTQLHTLNSTLPISSSTFDGLRSPMGSNSDVTEVLPPSITSTPLGLGGPRQWQTTSDQSRHSLALIYTSPGLNLQGYPAAGPGNLTPTVPSLAGSHHMLSTWPAGVFTSGPSSHHLTIDQANSLFKLATECQVLIGKLAKWFQVLSGLEAMHHNPIQGMAHETLTLGCSAWEAAYSAVLRDRVSEAKCEATTRHHCSEANTACKEMHEVMYNHQLQYD